MFLFDIFAHLDIFKTFIFSAKISGSFSPLDILLNALNIIGKRILLLFFQLYLFFPFSRLDFLPQQTWLTRSLLKGNKERYTPLL